MVGKPLPAHVSWIQSRSRWKLAAWLTLAVLALVATAGIVGYLLGSTRIQPKAMLLPGAPDAVKVARYGAKPFGPAADNAWTPDAVVTVTDIKRVARLAADTNNLPLFPTGNYNCPYSDGSHYELQFSFANGDRRSLFAERQGCEGVGFEDGPYGSGGSIA
ncbi:MAG: hypothetical protein ACYDAL_02315 [Candidatus Dormibacteraceae bacterium]